MYIIIGVLRVVLVFVDEVHHFFLCPLALANAGLLTPCLNSIAYGVIHIFTNIFKVATRRTYTTLFGKETSYIVDVKYLTSTFYLTVTYRKFIAKYLIQFIKEQGASRPCTFGVKRQQPSILVIIELCPVDFPRTDIPLCS